MIKTEENKIEEKEDLKDEKKIESKIEDIKEDQKEESTEEKNKFNKYKGINKANKTSKNYYKKILNFPVSPGNKKVKLLKINDLDIHEVASSFNYLDKEKDEMIELLKTNMKTERELLQLIIN